MPRRVFNFVTAMSLVLCVAVVALWLRSYWYADHSGYIGRSRTFCLDSWRGRLMWSDGNLPIGSTDWWQPRKLTGAETDQIAWQKTWLNRRGFIYDVDATPAAMMRQLLRFDPQPPPLPPVIYSRYASVPHWLPGSVLAALPGARAVGWLRRRRRKRWQGLCPSCGYDLCATPQRCPECGATA